jgi:hypothetical protein
MPKRAMIAKIKMSRGSKAKQSHRSRRIESKIPGRKRIKLVGEPRGGGYTFVKSPDLPGFCMMLRPGEDKDVLSVIDAIGKPLSAFLVAISKESKTRPHTLKIKGIRQNSPTEYLAELYLT